jgi:NAD(P)-dependent dehydrogenase (short-subunit alcohol dehydrogenase family)
MSARVLITGATDGLGRALAARLAAEGHRLVLHGRRADALEAIAAELAALPSAAATPPRTVLADLAQLEQVSALADTVTKDGEPLDVLVNNAGIGAGEPDGSERRVSPDGYELRFAVNYLAPAMLSLLLAPAMGADRPARIVNIASIGQAPLDFNDVLLEHSYSGSRAYGQSKLALITFGFTLAERLPASAVTVNSLHPGTYMPTKMVLQSVGHSIDSLQTGVDSTRRLILDPELNRTTGTFFDRFTPANAHLQAYDPSARKQLWTLTHNLLDIPDP